ncbi:MAG TPA: protein CapI [Rhodospirillaceae bacterium]|jgi:UDP-glucuronate 4-epimerase|nr:NAD-dependent epimerase/dehydratase family protein [Alphaproteobacteria bacterium]HBH26084.1 protein CapI [Rhodospirillaceae bacterium]
MSILVTGAAGFIGMHVVLALLERGERVLGLDNLNDYYDVALKEARLAQLAPHAGFTFVRADIADADALSALPPCTRVVHLAAQAGVRYSLENPGAYAQANLVGFLSVLEYARHTPGLTHMVYASSSSVYGANTKVPFSVADRVDAPVSLYAATKRSGELMAHAYAGLYALPLTGLRYFTVYGPWGRPDMAPFIFTKAVSEGAPVRLFNAGDMRRDFTYIDDIVAGTIAALDRPEPGHRVFNLGGHRPERLTDFLAAIEAAVGKKAVVEMGPMQPGDVAETYADIAATTAALGWVPATPMANGVSKFVHWYRYFYGTSSTRLPSR